ncbi:MAG: GDSL-type esterase/lipase family protein, partial [Thermoguttaceae bacterium]
MKNSCKILVSIGLLYFLGITFVFYLPQSGAAAEQKPEFRFEQAIQDYEKADSVTPPPVGSTLFVGSSTFALWKTIPDDFKAIKAVNRGFGGSTVPEVTQVLPRIITPFKPANVVFFCGGNDIAGGAEPEKVFDDFKIFLKQFWAECPECEIFFVSIFHAPIREKFWTKQDKYNALVKELATKTERLYFIDVRPVLADAGGKPYDKFFKDDMLHLSAEGQDAIVPLILKTVRDVRLTMVSYLSKEDQEKVEKAVSYYTQVPKKYNCAQSVAKAFGREDLVEELKASGGGRAPDGICGALYALFLLTPESDHAEFTRIFELSVGNLKCHDIKAASKT